MPEEKEAVVRGQVRTDTAKPIVELRGVSKTFPGVQALTDVNLDIRPGEVLALVGENGAGKSTLIKIITGFHRATTGSVLVDSSEVVFTHPHQAIEMGISCIYQELSIVPLMDVAENLFIGNWPQGRRGMLQTKEMYRRAEEILDHIGLKVSPKTLAGDLSIAEQQMVEIGRALTRNARVIIMDEPTSSLTDKESEILFGLIRKLKEEGVSIVYISHKLDEVMALADRISVLCDGRNVITVNTDETTRPQLIAYMLGRDLNNMYNKVTCPIGEPVMQVEKLTSKGVFKDISFQVRAGEVLGFFGLVGAGRSEIMKAIFGIDKFDSGDIRLNGERVDIRSAEAATRYGLALVPENRKREGLALELTVTENMTLPHLAHLRKGLFISKKEREAQTDKYIEEIRVKTPTRYQAVGNLSGGNQQKVVIGKWLMTDPKVLILDEPTRGIDIGSKAEIYSLICELAARGVGVIVVSSEMPELLGICDRIITVCEGQITGDFPIAEATDQKLLSAALGGETT